MTPEKAMEIMKSDVLVFGAMMVKKDKVDGMVAGAVNSTSNVIRAAVTVIKMAPGIKYASSCFIMESPYPEFGDNGKMVHGDCGGGNLVAGAGKFGIVDHACHHVGKQYV